MTTSELSATSALSPTPTAEELWDALYPPLAGWCKALVGDPEAARDIASEAFVRLLARRRHVYDPKGYLYVTATNLIREERRRQARDRA